LQERFGAVQDNILTAFGSSRARQQQKGEVKTQKLEAIFNSVNLELLGKRFHASSIHICEQCALRLLLDK